MSDAEVKPATCWYEPIHTWFGLTYSSYFVLPRSVLQSAERAWQERFIALMEELRETHGHHVEDDNYTVQLRGRDGRFKKDPLAEYRHAERLLPREREAVP